MSSTNRAWEFPEAAPPPGANPPCPGYARDAPRWLSPNLAGTTCASPPRRIPIDARSSGGYKKLKSSGGGAGRSLKPTEASV
jgi:hypothetical protein